jgi:hypothetical protein
VVSRVRQFPFQDLDIGTSGSPTVDHRFEDPKQRFTKRSGSLENCGGFSWIVGRTARQTVDAGLRNQSRKPAPHKQVPVCDEFVPQDRMGAIAHPPPDRVDEVETQTSADEFHAH